VVGSRSGDIGVNGSIMLEPRDILLVLQEYCLRSTYGTERLGMCVYTPSDGIAMMTPHIELRRS